MFKRLIKSPGARRRTSWVVAGVLILPFVFFFHTSLQGPPQGPGGAAGVIFGKEISWDEFEEQRLWLQRRLEIQYEGVPLEFLRPLLVQSTWDRLIILEEVRRTRLQVADAELAAFIRELPEFQRDGRFLSDLYHSLLRANGITPQTFEARLRKDLAVQQLANSVRHAVTISEEELTEAYHDAHDTLKASMFLVETASFRDATVISDEDLQAYFEGQAESFRVPEQLMVEYGVASRDELLNTIELPDDEVRAFYDDNPERFAGDEGDPRPFDEVQEEVRTQLRDDRLRARLNELALDLDEDLEIGRSFDEIVAARGLTRRAAGPLPVGNPRAPGAPEPAVLDAIASLETGELSRVIETDNGVSLARVTERIPSRIPALDEVRDTVRERLIQEHTRTAAREAADELHGQLTDSSSELSTEEVARLSGISPRNVQFTRTQVIEGIGRVPRANEAAFAATMRTFTEVIETPQGFVILHPEEIIPADETALAGIEAEFREQTLAAKQEARLREWLTELRDRAQLESFVEALPSAL